jgi:adenylate cyclase
MQPKTAIQYLFFVFFLFLSIVRLEAQSYADSISQALKTVGSDSNRVLLLVDYAWEINETQPGKASQALDEAIRLSQNLGFLRGEASAYNAYGVVAEIQGDYRKAIEQYNKALEIRKKIRDVSGMANTYINLGNAHEAMGDFANAIRSHRESLSLFTSRRDTVNMARAYSNIGSVLQESAAYQEAHEQVSHARELLERHHDVANLAKTYTQLGHIRFELDQFRLSKEMYDKSLSLRVQLGDEAEIADGYTDIANALDELNAADSAVLYYRKALVIYQRLGLQDGQARVYNNLADANKHLGRFGDAISLLDQSERILQKIKNPQGLMEAYNTRNDILFRQGKSAESIKYIEKYLAIALEIGDIKYEQRAYKDFGRAYAVLGEYQKAYEYRVKYDELRYKQLDETRSRTFEQREALFTDEQRKVKIENQRQDSIRQSAELADQRIQLAHQQSNQRLLIGGALGLLLLAGLLFNRNRLRARIMRELADKNKIIEAERHRADELLKNILPAQTAAELKQNNSVQPVKYESVTVMFTDFQNFTQISEAISPEELVEELDTCFRLFDHIVEKYGLEKIKTIGDSYMCAGGLPIENTTHPIDMVSAAKDMLKALDDYMKDQNHLGKIEFTMRVGIHTGPLVAGVVGSHKFAYDIWGDTVNIAARLEQASEAGRINISAATHERIRHQFQCTYRGKFPVKNKGEMDMYFVD